MVRDTSTPVGSRRRLGRESNWRRIALQLTVALQFIPNTHGFDISRNDNLAVYWGQNSGGSQQRLSFYCQDDVYDMIPLAFLYVFFGIGGEPMMSFANTCNEGNGTFSGTALSNCTFLEPDIEFCQSKGKRVTLSLGGAASSVGFVNASQAAGFADMIWNSYLGGSSNVRPLGNAVLDGVDLDIEGGLPNYYNNFVDRLRTHTDKASKTYYITAAPQCPFPDANIGPAINASRFDALYVQFYNNYCGLNYPRDFDFSLWDAWARTQSPNRDIKIYIGAPGSQNAANQGYVNPEVLQEYALAAQKNYSTFGGVMLWDASDAYKNGRYDKTIKQALTLGGRSVGSPGSGSGGSSGSGSGSGSNSTVPGGAGSGANGNSGNVCLQQKFSISKRDSELIARGGIGMLYSSHGKVIDVLMEIARYHLGHISSLLSLETKQRELPKYHLQRRMDL